MKIRLNGWQRIGIVVSVIWFIGSASFVWIYFDRDAIATYKFQYEDCRKQFDDYDVKLTFRCQEAASQYLSAQREANNRDIPILLAFDFGVIVLGWLMAWIIVRITRWVKRGFA